MAPPDTIWHKESLKLKEIFGTREGFEICPNQLFQPLIPPWYSMCQSGSSLGRDAGPVAIVIEVWVGSKFKEAAVAAVVVGVTMVLAIPEPHAHTGHWDWGVGTGEGKTGTRRRGAPCSCPTLYALFPTDTLGPVLSLLSVDGTCTERRGK